MCLSYTSVLASLEQASTRQQIKFKQTKSESVGERNTLSLFAVYIMANLFHGVLDKSL